MCLNQFVCLGSDVCRAIMIRWSGQITGNKIEKYLITSKVAIFRLIVKSGRNREFYIVLGDIIAKLRYI